MNCNFDLSVQEQPFNPATHQVLMQMKYGPVLEDKLCMINGLDYFQAEVDPSWLTSNMKLSHEGVIYFKKRIDPFQRVDMRDVTYDETNTCPARMDTDCSVGCKETADEWTPCTIRFDKEYVVSNQWCVTSKSLMYGDVEEQYKKNIEASQIVRGVYAWNKLICDAIAEPATTVNPIDAACFPTHYIPNAGDAQLMAVPLMTRVIAYMQSMFCNNDWQIFAHRFFELDLLAQSSLIHQYSNNGIPTSSIIEDTLVQGGFRPMTAIPGLWGNKVYIADDSAYYYSNGQNYHPFLNDDGTKYYVVLVSRGAFYTGVWEQTPGSVHFSATCDNPYEGYKNIFLDFNKIIRPEEVFVIEFDVTCSGI